MKDTNLTWIQVNNIVPIIVSFVVMALTFGALMTRVSVLEAKMDLSLSEQKDMMKTLTDHQSSDNLVAQRVSVLEAMIK